MRTFLFGVFISMTISLDAVAKLEVRIHYANSVYTAEDFNSYLSTSPNDLAGLRDQLSLGADIAYVLDSYPFLFGVRVEQMSKTKSTQGTLNSVAGTYNVGINRQLASFVTGFRVIDSETYLGLILGIGLNDVTTLTIDTNQYRSFSSSNYFGGFELGVTGQMSSFGVEFGYLSSSATDFKLNDAVLNDADSEAVVFDMTGPYLKFVLSFLF